MQEMSLMYAYAPGKLRGDLLKVRLYNRVMQEMAICYVNKSITFISIENIIGKYFVYGICNMN